MTMILLRRQQGQSCNTSEHHDAPPFAINKIVLKRNFHTLSIKVSEIRMYVDKFHGGIMNPGIGDA